MDIYGPLREFYVEGVPKTHGWFTMGIARPADA
jgi:hypothetical protein